MHHSTLQTSRKLLLAAAAIAQLVALPGCGSGTQQTQATLGPAGGTLALSSPAVTLEVPPGALATTTTVSLSVSSEPQALVVTLEPGQLALSRAAQLSVSVDGPKHISSVTEVSHRGEHPVGVDTRVEGSSGASTRMHLDHLTQVRVRTEGRSDAGTPPAGACTEDERSDDSRPDGGVPGAIVCDTGFECDDGVCVAPGGNDEHHGECSSADGGTCSGEPEHGDGGHP